MFADNIPLREIAKRLGIKLETVHRYHLQWKRDPGFEQKYLYAKSLFAKNSPYRDKNLDLYSMALGITEEQLETILSQPHGLRRLMSGKIYAPAHETADLKRSIAFELALPIANHLTKHGGSFEDVVFAFEHWMQENMKNRKQENAEIEEENRLIEIIHAVLKADAEQEREGRVKPDRLSEEERNTILRYGVKKARRETEILYWLRIAALMATGLTEEQAREKIYQDLLAKGDERGARMVREFQDQVHPLNNKDQEPQK
jgi:hypothetical protein